MSCTNKDYFIDDRIEKFLLHEYSLQEKQKHILYVLFYSAFCMEKFNIRYILFGGTLLGAIRNKCLIPWDDDIDLMVIEDDVKKLKSQDFIQELQKYNLNIVYESRYAFHIYLKDETECNYNNCVEISQNQYWRGVQTVFNKKPIGGSPNQIDIFIYSKNTKLGNYNYSPTYSKGFTKTYRPFLESELFPLKRYQLNNFWFYGPNIYDNYFKSFIKEDYLSNHVITHCHSTVLKRFISKEKIKLPHNVQTDSLKNLQFNIPTNIIINLYQTHQFDNSEIDLINKITNEYN